MKSVSTAKEYLNLFVIVIKGNKKFTILTLVRVQLTSVKYIHNAVQQLRELFHLIKLKVYTH